MLSLEQILEVVKEKHTNAMIEYVDGNKYVFLEKIGYDLKNILLINKDTIFINTDHSNLEEYHMYEKYIFNNIIELKHYFDIEIKWEDLVEYVKSIKIKYVEQNFDIDCSNSRICFDIFSFYKERNEIYVGTEWEGHLYENRSYWQIFNLIKNLVE